MGIRLSNVQRRARKTDRECHEARFFDDIFRGPDKFLNLSQHYSRIIIESDIYASGLPIECYDQNDQPHYKLGF